MEKAIKNIFFYPKGGDLFQFIPALRKYWKAHHEEKHIRLVIPERVGSLPNTKDILKHMPYCHEVVYFPVSGELTKLFGPTTPTKFFWTEVENLVKVEYPDIIRPHVDIKDKDYSRCEGVYRCRLQRLAAYIPVHLEDDEKYLEVFITDEERRLAKKIFQKYLEPNRPTLFIAAQGGRCLTKDELEEGIAKSPATKGWQMIEIGSGPTLGRGSFVRYDEPLRPLVGMALLEMCQAAVCTESMMLFAAIALKTPVWTRLKGQGVANYRPIIGWNEFVHIF